MKAHILSVRELSDADERAWQDLSERAVEPNPLFEPSFVIPAARHDAFGDEVALVVAEEGGQFHACFPIQRIPRWAGVPYPIVKVPSMKGLGTPLVDATTGLEAMRALLVALRQRCRRGRSGILVLEWLGTDGPVEGYVRSAAVELGLSVRVWESFERGMLRRRPDADYVRTFGHNLRHDLERRGRRFAEEFGEELTVTDRADDPDAINDYIALEGAGYKAVAGTAMTTIPGEPESFREMCQRFAAAGRLALPTISVDGRTLAMDVWLRGAEGMFMIRASFDENYARFDPGKQLHALAMNHFHHRTDAAWIDTCTFGGNDLLLRLYPDRRRITTLLIPLGRNPMDAAVAQSLATAGRVRQRLRRGRGVASGIASSRWSGKLGHREPESPSSPS